MEGKRIILAVFLGLLLGTQGAAAKTISLSDFKPNAGDAGDATRLTKALNALKAADVDTLKIPSGKYRIRGDYEKMAVVIEGLRGKKIVGDDATFLFGDPTAGGLLIKGVDGLVLSGLRLDWESLPFTQGVIRNVNKAEGWIAIDVMDGFPDPDAKSFRDANILWGSIHQPNGARTLDSHDVVPVKEIQKTGKGTFRLELKKKNDVKRPAMKPGNVFVLVARYPVAHAIKVSDSANVVIDGVEVQASPGMGIVVQPGCKDVSVINSRIRPKDPARFISTNADGIHVIEPRGKLQISGNVVNGTQDDAVVVSRRGQWARYDEESKTIILKENDPTVQFDANQKIEALIPGSGLVSIGSVKNVSRSSSAGARISVDSPKKLGVSKNEEIAVFPINTDAASVSITKNTIENIRGIGIRLNFANVTVEGNKVLGTVGSAMRMGCIVGERWEPQYPSQNITVTGNTFRGFDVRGGQSVDSGMIDVTCFPENRGAAYGKSSSGIRITDNTFEGGLGFSKKKISTEHGKDVTVR